MSIVTITSLSLVSTQINTPAVHSISVTFNNALELSHSSQLQMSISSTSNSISKPSVTKQTSTGTKAPPSQMNHHSLPLSPKPIPYHRKDNIHQHHPPIHFPFPPSSHPSPFLHSPSPQAYSHHPLFKSPFFPQSTTIHQQPPQPTPPLHSTHSTLNNSPFPPTTLGVPNHASTPPSPISTQGVSTGTGIIAFFKVRTGFLLPNPIPFPCTLSDLSVDTP